MATDEAVIKPARDSEGAQVIELLGWGTHSSVQYTSGYTAVHCSPHRDRGGIQGHWLGEKLKM